ncbi:MAG TPA: O-antigen ligase family protein [Vicinamibacterales bacterium]|nr:O-antigen ligase family protein [Vicinamibacterales bacterium]
MSVRSDRLEWIGFLLIAACLGVVQFSIFLAQSVLFSLAAILWLIVTVRDGRRPDVPPFFLPLVVYAGLTLVSSAFSTDPSESFWDSRQLLLWLLVPIVCRFARGGTRATTVLNVIIALGAAGALVGIIQWAMFGYDNETQRPVGTLSHYMTYSGVLMLVTATAVSSLVFRQREWVWPAIAVPALVAALAFTLSRSAYVGMFAAVLFLLAQKHWKLVLVAPVVAALLVAIAPATVRNRVFSIVDVNNPTNRDRVAMWKVGAGMVRAHPLFGVGPEQVGSQYHRYRPAEYVNATNPHLHNVPIQIAAERGIPALLAWLWFVVVAARDLLRQTIRGPNRAVAGAGAAAVVAMLFAGMFEYNFGDSEFLMLFLGLISLPHAAAAGEDPAADTAGVRPIAPRREPVAHVG